MKPYEIIEHTADVGLKVSAKTLKELFENAAKGMFGIITGEDRVKSLQFKVKRDIRIKKEVEGLEELLVDWLTELLYIFNKEEILFDNFRVVELDSSGITGELQGNRIDLSQETLQTEIKAVTFHNLKIEEDKSGFSCKIIFDV